MDIVVSLCLTSIPAGVDLPIVIEDAWVGAAVVLHSNSSADGVYPRE